MALAISGALSGVGSPFPSFPPKLMPAIYSVLQVKQELFKGLYMNQPMQVVKFNVYVPPFENPPRHLGSCCSAVQWGVDTALIPFTAISGLHLGYLMLCFYLESLDVLTYLLLGVYSKQMASFRLALSRDGHRSMLMGQSQDELCGEHLIHSHFIGRKNPKLTVFRSCSSAASVLFGF